MDERCGSCKEFYLNKEKRQRCKQIERAPITCIAVMPINGPCPFYKVRKVPAIQISQMGGLKCDNPFCGWQDMNIKVDEYKKYVGAKCPWCGECILTEKDYKINKRLLRVIKIINFILPKRYPKDDDVMLSCKFDGTGKVKSEIKGRE